MISTEKLKTIGIYELKKIFKDVCIENNLTFSIQLFRRAIALGEHFLVTEKLKDFFDNKRTIEKYDTDLLECYLIANIKLRLHERNVKLYKNVKKINVEFKNKGMIFNCFAFSFVEINMYLEAKNIFYTIKNIKDEYLEDYIDCLINLNNFEEAIKELKKYAPKSDRGRIFKAINTANIYCKKDDIKNLKKYYLLAKKTYSKYRISEEIDVHTPFLFELGIMEIKLGHIIDAILTLQTAIDVADESAIETIYKNKSADKLRELGVAV